MKHTLALIILLFCFVFLRAAFPFPPTEGMWIPSLLKEYQESEMRASGLRLTAEDIYSINRSSLKDAVLLFGGGCTGSVISDQGLIITNHHCGFSSIQTHSTLEHNYLKDGFWAKSFSEELQNPGLTVTFIVSIENVTAQVLEGVTKDMNESERNAKIKEHAAALEKAKSVNGWEAKVRAFFYGNEFYLFQTETFRDVRLVGAPPNSIGNFGRDTDNWVWPRHTADFTLFRIYANKENKPADPSPENVPWKPRRSLKISLKGVNEGDFTMVYGFPGRTTEYLSSWEVDFTYSVLNPVRIAIRDIKLDIMDRYMRQDPQVKIQYSAKYARVANYWKKWMGENNGLKKLDAVNVKKEEERRFLHWTEIDEKRRAEYHEILPELEILFRNAKPYYLTREYLNEAALGMEIVTLASKFRELSVAASRKETSKEELDKIIAKLKAVAEGHFKDYDRRVDRELCIAMLKQYRNASDLPGLPDIFPYIDKKFKGDLTAWTDHVFAVSCFADKEKLMAFLDAFTLKSLKKLQEDPAYRMMESIVSHYEKTSQQQIAGYVQQAEILNRRYMKAQMEMQPEHKFYPDANGTLRLTWGKVEGYEPRDGVKFNWYTTLEGVMEKYIPGDEEFDVDPRLMELIRNKDYGNYGVDGKMRVAFIASNHTTGGNSGSPVLNGDGEFIGINFDRAWESTMSDIMFDPDRCRNITADARYILFIVDKFAGAGHLVKEMNLSR